MFPKRLDSFRCLSAVIDLRYMENDDALGMCHLKLTLVKNDYYFRLVTEKMKKQQDFK